MDEQGPPSDLPTPPPEEPTPPSPYEATTVPAAYEGPGTTPHASRARVTALVVAVLLVLTGTGTALLLRASNSEQSVDKFIPDTVAAYMKISLHPSVEQQKALDDLLSRFPSSVRGQVSTKIDGILDSGLKNFGLSYSKDIKPWVGGQIALAVLSPGGSTSDTPTTAPNVIGVVPVKDASSAQNTLSKIKSTVPHAPAFEVVGGVAYLGKTQGDIDAFRNSVTAGHTLADNATYKREHDRAGGDGLLFLYADLSKLGGLKPSLPGDLLGGGLTGGTGVVSAGLRAESQGLVLAGHSSFPTSASSPKGGTLKILPTTPDDLIGSVSFFDLGDLVNGFLKGLTGQLGLSPTSSSGPHIPGLSSVTRALQQAEKALGLNLQKDLLPWLRGEFSVVVGRVTTPPIPDIGIMIEPTDQAALGRTMTALRKNLGALASSFGGSVSADSSGFAVKTKVGPTIVIRTTPDRVVIATSQAYANRLLHPSGSSLAGDTVYMAAVDPSKPTTFQMFVRLDRLRALIEGFINLSNPAGQGAYERNIQPLVKPLQALGIQSTVTQGEQDFRMVITIAKP